MLKNYFKIAIAVLKRRKFFTFISLFGISFTLTILLVATSFIEKTVGDTYPDRKRSRSLYLRTIMQSGPGNMMTSEYSLSFLEKYVAKMKTPEKYTFISNSDGTNTYVNNKKIGITYKYTDANFWDVLEYDFIEGKPYTLQQLNNAEKVVVITEAVKKSYFGEEQSVVGKFFEADNVQYRVCGVVKSLPPTAFMTYADLYLPFTVSKRDQRADKSYQGNFSAIIVAPNKADVPKMAKEFEDIIRRLPMPSKDQDKIESHADDYLHALLDRDMENGEGVSRTVTAIVVFALLVMILPTLNLVNINITRILERSSEIGVRKAFGASAKTLVYQFLVENIILTFIGGLLGVVFSMVAISLLNQAQLVPNLVLTLNFKVLGIGVLICLVFGLLSGVYPAWRMSKLNIVTALKA